MSGTGRTSPATLVLADLVHRGRRSSIDRHEHKPLRVSSRGGRRRASWTCTGDARTAANVRSRSAWRLSKWRTASWWQSAIRDITDRKRAEAQRTRLIREHAARSEAEAASRAKEEFLAILSHELRNPLNAVLNAVAVLDEIGVQDPSAIKARLFAASLNGSQGCVMIFWTWPDCRLEGRPRDSAP